MGEMVNSISIIDRWYHGVDVGMQWVGEKERLYVECES